MKHFPGIFLAALIFGCIGASAQSTFQSISAGLTPGYHGTAAWGDYDQDGYLDLLLTGEHGGTEFANIYRGNGSSFTPLNPSPLTPVGGAGHVSRSAWGDYDNDGDLDVIVVGRDGNSNASTTLYENNAGVFAPALVATPQIARVFDGAAAWGDCDNDGDLDLFLCGVANNIDQARILRNDGLGALGWIFTDISGIQIPGVRASDGAWGDYDRDGDLDLAVMGSNLATNYILHIYRNDGGMFARALTTNIAGSAYGNISWSDYNNDGWLDLTVSGDNGAGPGCRIFRNNHDRTFTSAIAFSGTTFSSVSHAWGDCNNDGWLDLLMTGELSDGATVWLADGSGSFNKDNQANLPVLLQFAHPYGSWGDYDNDGRLDIALTGSVYSPNPPTDISEIYHNTSGASANTPPSAPAGLALVTTSRSITASWNPSTDGQTPQGTLTYNLYVKNVTTGKIVMSPMANLSTGKRYLPAMGNTNHLTRWTIGGLTPGGEYEVCVQAIDQAFAGSAFTCANSVTLPTTDPDVMIGDCISDLGAEPNSACGAVVHAYWDSPNIYIRHQPDGHMPGNDVMLLPDLTPGATNYVYARLENIGTTTMPGGRVHFYFAKASAGTIWPIHWSGYTQNGVVMGDFIGQEDVPSLIPGAVHYAKVLWNNIPAHINDPADYHFCLVARFVSASDPMTALEGPSLWDNTVNNNNIAWRNISRLDLINRSGNIDAGISTNISLGFEFAAKGDLGMLTDHATVRIKLPDDVLQRWIANGSAGEGIVVVEDGEETVIQILSEVAYIQGIPLEADERFTASVEVVFPDEIPDYLAGETFYFGLAEYKTGDDTPVGGETYEVFMGEREAAKRGMPDEGDLSEALRISAQPNPTRSSTTISYTLPRETNVTLSLYDAAGTFIRTLVRSQQSAGNHHIEWNGTGAEGTAVPSGTYFYRLETPEGVARGQITIAR